MQSVAVIIDFIYGQSIFFKSCDCRSEGVVPANTYLKRLVRKRKFRKHIFHKKMYSEVGFELLPTKNITFKIQVFYCK